MNHVQSLQANSSDLLYNGDPDPLTMLETFVPIASPEFISDIFEWFNFASYTWVLRIVTVMFAIISSISYFWTRALYYISLYYETSITIEQDDQIHTHVMAWLAVNVSTRRLQARTAKASGYSDDQNRVVEYNASAKDGKFHLIEWQKFLKPDFEPHMGEHVFSFRGRRFWITRSKDEHILPDHHSKQFSVNKNEYIRISCWGQSADPIKEFLQESKRAYLNQECSKTRIFRPKDINWSPKWYCAAIRATRPIGTISLEESTKRVLLRDVNEFLNPKSPRWYANRGIPYRRGYLLHGPPGTGKTSLSFALGGLFGLPIYCLSLVDAGMTEDRLLACFGELPNRCIVLLEDIDTVDISRRRDDVPGEKRRDEQNTQMTLSGLLNAIDGVASHEGRILIMTTNRPEILDPALVRNGRVDLEVPFKLATKEQIVNLFTIMYSHDYDDEEEEKDEVLKEKLVAAALRFGELLDADMFSPAEITEFLMARKHDYWKALRDVKQWKEEVLAKREEALLKRDQARG